MRFGKYNVTGITVLNGLGVLVVIYLVGTLGQTIKHNYDLNRQINQLSGQVALLQAQKDQLSYQIKYYGTTSYQQRQAHSQLNLQAPGETEVVLPSPAATPTPAATATARVVKRSNWSQWLSFLTGHNN
ncbi:septum formation initiator family protein [Candidatus Saccharibacteria bacterium]|nr:septum formation initiator family protein [Candidatus Saccharibacteria bacterium]